MQSFLAFTRMAIGLGFLTAPHTSATLFRIPFTTGAAIAWRMVGTRDIIIGALLYTARRSAASDPKVTDSSDHGKTASSPHKRDNRAWSFTQRALLAGVVCDAVDVLTCLWCYLDGSLPLTPALLFGAGASLAVDLGVYCLYF
ncbi:hypothetical protein BJY01DRAFT_238064 [Aspergillus pseudoustus]|uniref:Uncharacterized protein n=1 Tax=Aspergillus pseudoustus TaxID=1810923 RepID=A0ABR4JA46_9EURO